MSQKPLKLLFEDPKIIRNVFLHCKNKEEFARSFVVLNKKISSVIQSAPFKSDWIIKNNQHELDLWLQNFLKKIDFNTNHYQDWISHQIYHAQSTPLFIDNMINDQVVVSRLIHHYGSTRIDKDRLKGLWLFLLTSRSLVGISLVLEDSIFFQTLLDTPWLWKFCVYACIFTPTLQDSQKGLAVLKFILENSGDLGLYQQVLGESLSLAANLNLLGHVEILSPLCSEEKRVSIWSEIANKSQLGNRDLIQNVLENSLPPSLMKLLSQTKSILKDESSGTKYLKFEQLVLEHSMKGYHQILRDIWSALNEQCIQANDVDGIKKFAGFYRQDEHLILPLSQFDLAISKSLDDACEVLVPLVDCVIPGARNPTKAERFSILFTEYCKTPKKILFSQLNYTPVFSSQELAKLKKKVVEHQIAVASYLYRSLKEADPNYKPQSTDVWESIQAGNSELSTLLQKWGGTAAWMEDLSSPLKSKIGNRGFQKENSEGYPDDESDVDSQSGMFMAFDGEKSGFAATKKMSILLPVSHTSFSADSENSQSRVNIFASDKNSGHVLSLLGARRVNQATPQHGVQSEKSERLSECAKSKSTRRDTSTWLYNQQSNQIWEQYFKSDLKKLEKIMSETSLTNFDWMEFQTESNVLRGIKLKDKNLANESEKNPEEQALLQKYTQLY